MWNAAVQYWTVWNNIWKVIEVRWIINFIIEYNRTTTNTRHLSILTILRGGVLIEIIEQKEWLEGVNCRQGGEEINLQKVFGLLLQN